MILMPYSNIVTESVRWFSATRSDLPAVLEGRIPVASSMLQAPTAEVSIGIYTDEDDHPILTLIVVEDKQLTELLAWLSTFAPELFPLSQSVRVLTRSDYSGIEGEMHNGEPHRRDLVWPSIILGEMLAQGEPAPNLATLPLSRASASFSFCQARASLLYPLNSKVNKVTTARLHQLQNERSFTQRLVNVHDMLAIWSFVDEYAKCTPFQKGWIEAILSIVETGVEPNYASAAVLERIGIDARKMASGPIEVRVLEFERAISLSFNAVSSNNDMRSNIPLIVAGLCFLVGGGTSHISLLDEFASDFPTVYAWFGLLAGLAGPGTWDAQWARTSTSVEKLLRSGFSMYDPPTADICWAEYEWIASQRQSLPWLKELPKLYPRLVSVEVIPGATCQFRLGDAEDVDRQVNHVRPLTRSVKIVETPRKVQADEKVASIEIMLLDVLRELKGLRNESVHGLTQEDMFPAPELPGPAKAKPPRKRAVKK